MPINSWSGQEVLIDVSLRMAVIKFGKGFTENFKNHSDAALKSLFNNFIEPLKSGVPVESLPGKYKPSWEVPDFGTSMQYAFKKVSQEKNLHHYHIGYRRYYPGRDPKYPGMESEGITHTMIVKKPNSDSEIHVILRLDEKHPSPFTIPMDFEFE